MSEFLSVKQVAEFKILHKTASLVNRDRIKAILMLNSGYTQNEVAEVLIIDETTVWRWFDLFRKTDINELLKDNYSGGISKLEKNHITALDSHLSDNIYLSAKEICSIVYTQFGVKYTTKGMTNLLHRIGYCYKKPKHIPGKTNLEVQINFVEQYEKLKKEKSPEDKIYFMDGVHPLHNSQPAYGWMKKNCNYTIHSNTGRERVNINGAINIENFRLYYNEDETINSQSVIKLFKKILKGQRRGIANIFTDNARYYKSNVIVEFLKRNRRINVIYLPSYSPNLNLIERLWRFMRKKVTYNKYYEKFSLFKSAILYFLDNIQQHNTELKSLLTQKFQLINPA